MSKQWKPGRQTVALRPSRIRRDPVPVGKKAKVRVYSPELELWGGVSGIVLFAAGIAIVTVGIGAATIFRNDPQAAAQAARFSQCYNAAGSNCVLDGDTIYAGGEKLQIAGIETPQILDAACAGERDLGIAAAVQLADLLNGGKVTVGATFRDEFGRDVRKVSVDGRDVGQAMINAGAARRFDGEPKDWC